MRRQRTARDPTVVSREAIRDSRESRDNRDEEETDREEEEQALSFRLPRNRTIRSDIFNTLYHA